LATKAYRNIVDLHMPLDSVNATKGFLCIVAANNTFVAILCYQ